MGYRDQFNFGNLRITAWMRTPVIGDEWLPLDGILLYQAHREISGNQVISFPGKYSSIGVCTLPIDIAHPGRKIWFYRCSWAEWGPRIEGKDFWNKRFDFSLAEYIDFRGRRGAIDMSQGEMKAYRMPIFYISSLWIRWYLRGDRNEIERLLASCTHIGKKAVQGWGRVMKWEIEEIEDDFSIWKDGKLMRGIPDVDVPDEWEGKKGIYGIRPSYWNKNNQMELVLP